MPRPSQQERKKTRKRLLAAEAALLLLLLASQKSRISKAALVAALVRGFPPLRQLARLRIAAELGRKAPAETAERALPKQELRRIEQLAGRFAAYAQERRLNTPTPELRQLAKSAIDARLRMIAANEAVRVFEQERRLAASAFAKDEQRAMSKRWDATLDGDTCDECSLLDGLRIPLKDEFDPGDPPLHPHCRCSIEYSFDT